MYINIHIYIYVYYLHMMYVYTSFLLREYAAAGDFRKSRAYSNPLVRVQISVLCLRTRIALYIHYNVMRDRLR